MGLDDVARLTDQNRTATEAALMGNCGVTFAPCKPSDRELLAAVMETVEDIPKHAIITGLLWTWEQYGGYLDAHETLKPGINVAGLVGHSAVRYYVMGDRSLADQATPGEVEAMAEVVGRAMDSGTVGFSTNRYEPHKAPTADLSRARSPTRKNWSLSAEPSLRATASCKRSARTAMC